MFVPLFVLSLVGTSTYLVTAREPVVRKVGVLLVIVVALGASVHTVLAANLSHSVILRGNASTKQMIDDLTAHYDSTYGQDGTQVQVGISAIFKPVVEYYTVTRQLDWLKVQEFNTLREDYDYYYYDLEDGRVLDNKNLIRLDTYPQTGGVLATKIPD